MNVIRFVFTAPYGKRNDKTGSKTPNPNYNAEEAHKMIERHGLFARAIGIRVEDAVEAFNVATANGANIVMPPTCYKDKGADGKTRQLWLSEIQYIDDVVLRFMSGDFITSTNFIPGYTPVESPDITYGLQRVDHIVTNVWKLLDVVKWFESVLGFHEFAEFTSEDVGTIDSGLNSMVMSSNNEMVLLPVNEPTYGTNRKSQIQTYLEFNEGPGVQHIALKTNDIFATMTELRKRTLCGGFAFMPKPSAEYYKNLPKKFGKDLSDEQYRMLEEMGLLADKDEEGILLQVFTKPLGDRSTLFIEVIQRIGCQIKDPKTHAVEQKAGCGGFGKGNFSELFKSIEDFEKQIDKAAGRMY